VQLYSSDIIPPSREKAQGKEKPVTQGEDNAQCKEYHVKHTSQWLKFRVGNLLTYSGL
jgi:hypothetical protein